MFSFGPRSDLSSIVRQLFIVYRVQIVLNGFEFFFKK